MKASVRSVIQNFNQSTGKAMTSKDFRNAKAKMQPQVADKKDENHEGRSFAAAVNRIKANPENYVAVRTVNDEMLVCFFTTKSQREWFDKYPEIIDLDATYKFNCFNYI